MDNREDKYSFQTKSGKWNDSWFRKCRCKCGNIVYVKNHHLIKASRRSCADCYHKHYQIKTNDINHVLARIAAEIKYRAIKGRAKYLLTEIETIFFIQQNCHYCNSSPDNIFKKSINPIKWMGIDRICPDDSYNILNCVPCCKTCNFMKQKLSYDSFLSKVKLIYENKHLNIELSNWRLVA